MKKCLLFLFLSSIFCRVATARNRVEETSPSDTLAARVAVLEARTSAWDKIVSRLPEFSGYVQAGYQYGGGASSFFLKRVRLSIAGDIVPKLDYKIQFEFCKPQLVDAYLQYSPFRQLQFRVGQYKIPFSIENTDYPPTRFELIEYPLALSKLVGFGSDLCGISATGRELGATLSGGFFKREGYSIVNYDLGLFNGEGINTWDKNKSKDVVARLSVRPVDGLLLSGSYYWGEYGASYFKRERYGAGICYDRGAVVVRGEWIGGRTGSDHGEFGSDGWYLLAGWRAPYNLMPVVRFDTFAENTSARSATRQDNYTVGLLWAPVKHLRCQINYTYEDYGPAFDTAARSVVAVMFTGMF